MKIIFLDIDGVLNGYNKWNTLLYKIIKILNIKKLRLWYKKVINPFGIHESKVKRLAKIVKKTNAKIVMSSSWRITWSTVPYEKMSTNFRKLYDLFNKYNIKVIDITPVSYINSARDKEILSWLSKHEHEVDNFIILDDENTHLKIFNNDKRFIQTSSVPIGTMIKGLDYENTGLNNKHVKRAIKILNKKEN